jgi:hypothetical protein
MVRRGKPASRSPRFPARWPFVPAWCAGVLVSGAVLVELAYLIGRDVKGSPDGTPDAVLTAASSPGVAVAIAFGAVVLGAWCCRHLVLHWLAWWPGSIHVAEFKSATPDVDVEDLTMTFRRRLSSLQIQSPTPVPGAAPAGDFLDVLDRNGVDPRNILGSAVGLLRAAVPTHAFEVRGVLLTREEQPRHGVAIEVIRLPSEGTMSATVWGETWDVALRKAAHEATGAILPQTRRCRAPWGVWRGQIMPSGLLHAYEEGARLEHDHRYDEALDAYYAALGLDPMNMVLRLRIGQLQERLGLHVDALAMYLGMCASNRPAGVRLPRLLYRGRGRRERRRALVSARYRRDVLLGGRVLAEQWRAVPEDPANRRDEERQRLRRCLRGQLAGKLAPYASSERVARALAEPEAEDLDTFLLLRELTARYAIDSATRLRRKLRRRVTDRRATLTPATVRLTEECIGTRLRWVRYARGADSDWPPSAKELNRSIRRIELGVWRFLPARLQWRSFRRWHEHYNAACAYALPLQDETLNEQTATTLARWAVARLQKATARADSAFIASRREWLVSQDPDLDGLRARPEFGQFEVMHLPSNSITPRRPPFVQQLENSRYVGALLVATARQWQAAWRRRREELEGGPDVRTLLQWFHDELQTWTDTAAVARHYRHSVTRLTLIRNLQACAWRYGFEAPVVAFPRYEDDPLEESLQGDPCGRAARAAVKTADDRLAALRDMLGEHRDERGRMLADLDSWGATLRRQDAAGHAASPYLVAQLCDCHAALWQLLHQWLEAGEESAARAEHEFRSQCARTRRLWRVAFQWWLPVTDTLAERRNGNGSERLQPVLLLRKGAQSAWWHARIAQADRRERRRVQGRAAMPG